ncbi:9b975fb1-86ec-43a9-bc25-c8da4d1d2869 [Thermothielavioides terrestris]|uniref:9b975fb1-86ec-43a9-bc25-c8da4d1d2869 n=1 Tax=Thermothielavioides terrestris TaxID=2587410 RepID=A0A3S5CWT5_9PEZI|nr:9b975fb1-86ec-43a9-bc25-c8da4d1d2869 [Thermothielavioides terrestris]
MEASPSWIRMQAAEKEANLIPSGTTVLISAIRLTMSSSSSSTMNKYWIPHLDIHKKVITQELQYYLGPGATVRPFTRDGLV